MVVCMWNYNKMFTLHVCSLCIHPPLHMHQDVCVWPLRRPGGSHGDQYSRHFTILESANHHSAWWHQWSATIAASIIGQKRLYRIVACNVENVCLINHMVSVIFLAASQSHAEKQSRVGSFGPYPSCPNGSGVQLAKTLAAGWIMATAGFMHS